MTNKHCPYKKHCFDKGSCETCDYGIALDKAHKKVKRLKDKNDALEKENEELKQRIETILHPNF